MTTAEKIAIMQAADRGEHIEIYNQVEGRWLPCPAPSWNWSNSLYRIALKQPVTRNMTWKEIAKYIGSTVVCKGGAMSNNKVGLLCGIQMNGHINVAGFTYALDTFINCFTLANGTPFTVTESAGS